jgi:hypothetical protein
MRSAARFSLYPYLEFVDDQKKNNKQPKIDIENQHQKKPFFSIEMNVIG